MKVADMQMRKCWKWCSTGQLSVGVASTGVGLTFQSSIYPRALLRLLSGIGFCRRRPPIPGLETWLLTWLAVASASHKQRVDIVDRLCHVLAPYSKYRGSEVPGPSRATFGHSRDQEGVELRTRSVRECRTPGLNQILSLFPKLTSADVS